MFALIMLTFLAWTRERPAASAHGWLEAARRANLEQLTATAAGPDADAPETRPAGGADGAARDGAAAKTPRKTRPVDIDSDDEQLAAYNAFLARINSSERARQDR
jgi:hypothetical protein